MRLVSRNGRSLNGPFPELVDELHALPGDFAIDSELVVLDGRGHPQFEHLSARALMLRPFVIQEAARTRPAALFAFDLLAIDGKDLRRQPLLKRKSILERVLKAGERIRYLNHVGENGERLLDEVSKRELEGIVGKKGDAVYTSGRCKAWVKVKTPAGKEREAARMEHLRRG